MKCKSVGFGTETSWFRDDIQNYVSYSGVNELETYSCSSLKRISCGYTPHSQGVNLHQASTCMVAGVILNLEFFCRRKVVLSKINRRKTELNKIYTGVRFVLSKHDLRNNVVLHIFTNTSV